MKVMYKGVKTDVDNELVKAINKQQHINTAYDMLQDFKSNGGKLTRGIEDFNREELEQLSMRVDSEAFVDCGVLEVEAMKDLEFITITERTSHHEHY